MKRALGVCYYPEQWPDSIWADDARRMVEMGLTWVRIGEFAWSRLEPTPGRYNFVWLDQAINVLGAAGLKVMLGTPTATPPRWMLDCWPDMLAHDAEGRPRGFGSRRHYCFSHQGYQADCARITAALAERYGRNPHVAAWQTDNEYGCHDTVVSYSPAARAAFRVWLQKRYGDIGALNAAWGNVFWSMEYGDFDQIGLPNLTVTEPNPAHALAFRRFSSDQAASFNRLQVDILRAHSGAPIAHNYMGRVTDFDHFNVGEDLDIAGWDSYPLGFLEDRILADDAHKRRFSRTGDPDFQAFHHDLYRAVGRGRWWIIEQQPGPVNWAPYNPAPAPGAVRLWAWEAFAHGAETVCWFRWRQAPFAQEQMHAGLLRPDGSETPACDEIRAVAAELADAPETAPRQSAAALIFDYDAEAMWAVQPQGRGLTYFDLAFDAYRAMRSLGVSVDILPPGARDFSGYKLVLAPGLAHMPDDLKTALAACGAQVMIGPRTGAKTTEFATPVPLPPAFPGLDARVDHVETLRSDSPVSLQKGGAFQGWREHLSGEAEVLETAVDGAPAVIRANHVRYMAGWPDQAAFQRIVSEACAAAGLQTSPLPDGVRRRDDGAHRFWINYTQTEQRIDGRVLPPVSVVREEREI